MTGEAPGSRPVFDAPATWDRLTPAEQREIGLAALVFSLSDYGTGNACDDGVDGRRFETAQFEATAILSDAVMMLVERHHYGECAPDGSWPVPDLAQLGVHVCRICGCTESHACLEGCAWSARDPLICTACEGASP